MRIFVMRAKSLLIFFVCIAILLGTAGLWRATQSVRASAAETKRPIYSVDTKEKKVSLGINCAWDNADIPVLIEILKTYQIQASFFVVGDWCDRYPESVRAIYEAGHEIGTHSDSHPDMTTLDREQIVNELRKPAEKIEAVTGVRPTLFRAPSGAYNTLVIETAEQEGFYPIQWDCDSIDYKNPTADQMQGRIMAKLRNGSIMLFHSGAKNTPGALPQIIQAVLEKGYAFVPISELIYPAPYTVDFEGRQHNADTVGLWAARQRRARSA